MFYRNPKSELEFKPLSDTPGPGYYRPIDNHSSTALPISKGLRQLNLQNSQMLVGPGDYSPKQPVYFQSKKNKGWGSSRPQLFKVRSSGQYLYKILSQFQQPSKDYIPRASPIKKLKKPDPLPEPLQYCPELKFSKKQKCESSIFKSKVPRSLQKPSKIQQYQELKIIQLASKLIKQQSKNKRKSYIQNRKFKGKPLPSPPKPALGNQFFYDFYAHHSVDSASLGVSKEIPGFINQLSQLFKKQRAMKGKDLLPSVLPIIKRNNFKS